MKHLILRSLREIRSTKAQFISIIMIIAIGSAIFSGLFSTVHLIETWLDDYYTTTNFADGWIYVSPVDNARIVEFQADNPLLAIEGRSSFQLESVLKGESVTYRFYTQTAINGLLPIQGEPQVQDNDILIDESFAQKNGLSLNDPITISVDDQTYTFHIKGTFQSPEFAYKSVDFSDSMSNKKGFGIIYASHETLIKLNHHSDIYKKALAIATSELDQAQAALDKAMQTLLDQQALLESQRAQIILTYQQNPVLMQQVLSTLIPHQNKLEKAFSDLETSTRIFEKEKAEALVKVENLTTSTFELLVKGFKPDITAFVITLEDEGLYQNHRLRSDHPAFTMLDNVLSPIKVMTSIFPILFFLVASIIILISMSKTIENERTQIAVFKALGLKKSSIVLSYLFYGWWAALAGSIIFAILGNIMIPKLLMAIFTTRYSLPDVPYAIYPIYTIIAVALSIFFASVAILLAIRPILNEIPAQGMRPKPPKSTKRSMLERWPWFWKNLSYTQKLITRNILMGKVKILLSSIGIIGSIALLITGLSLRNSASLMINSSIDSYQFQYAIQTLNNTDQSNLTLPIESTKIERAKVIPGEINDISMTVQMVETHQTLMALRDHAGSLIEVSDDSVIITKSMAIIFDLQVGERVDFVVDDLAYSAIITNITNQYLNKNMIITFNRAQSLGLESTTNRFYVSTPSQIISQSEIESLLNDDQIQSVDTKIKYQKTSEEMMSMLNTLIMVIVLSSLLLSMTVIYNLASINIFERQRELATLRVLGYTVREVENLVYAENYLLTILGALGGLPAGIFLFQTIAHLVSSNEFVMSSEIKWSIMALAVFSGFFFTFVTNRILRFKIVSIKLVESLKAVE